MSRTKDRLRQADYLYGEQLEKHTTNSTITPSDKRSLRNI